MPASLASSTTYWISGLSTMVSISFGIALVAGRTRVPRPATGKTALRIFMGDVGGLAREGARDCSHGGSHFAPGNKGGCVMPIVSSPLACRRGQKQNLAFVKLLETATRPSETGFQADG